MRQKWAQAGLAALAAMIVAGCSTAGGRGGSGAAARIRSVEGAAEVARGQAKWEPAHLWQKLHAGDRARTAPHGTIDFTLGRYGGVLTLMPDSAITFEKLGPESKDDLIVGIIHLEEGRIVGDTLKLPPNRRIQIKTRAGTQEIP